MKKKNYSIELKAQFDSKADMLKAVYAQKDNIISLKKKNVYEAHKKGQGIDFIDFHSFGTIGETVKSLSDNLEKGFIYPIISNTNFADEYNDVHLKGSMTKTVNEQQGKIHYAINHDLSVGNIIAYPKDVTMLLQETEWKDIGKALSGSTELLLFKIKDNLYKYSNNDARLAIEEKLPVKNSIRMRYIDISLGIKERSKDWALANHIWDMYANDVVNISEKEEEGYLWFVKELAILHEGSMVVNPANIHTDIIYVENNNSNDSLIVEPLKQSTSQKDPDMRLKELLETYSFTK